MNASGGNALIPTDARRFDEKFDDGKPASGKIFVSPANAMAGCLNTDTYTAAANTVDWYSNPNVTTRVCQVHFWLD